MNINRLAIVGASGHGKVCAEIAEKQGWKTVQFFDALWPDKKMVGRWNIVGDEKQLLKTLSEYDAVFIAIGDNAVRAQKQKECLSHGVELATLIATTAIISSDATIGNGVLIAEGTKIGIDAEIAQGVIINTGSIVEHDCIIKEFSHISPGVNLAGNVIIGVLSWIGIGSNIIQSVKIGTEVIVGAGSVVINDISDKQTVCGTPAKLIEKGS